MFVPGEVFGSVVWIPKTQSENKEKKIMKICYPVEANDSIILEVVLIAGKRMPLM